MQVHTCLFAALQDTLDKIEAAGEVVAFAPFPANDSTVVIITKQARPAKGIETR